MGCRQNIEYCTRTCGCSDCPNNEGGSPAYIGTKEWEEECSKNTEEATLIHDVEQKKFFKNIIPQCVKHLLNVDGVGFFIQDYFVTAGHSLLKDGFVKITHNGKDMTFNKDDALIFLTIDTESTEEQYGDVAIFACKGITPFFKVGMEPDEFHYTIFDKPLWIASYEHKSSQNPNNLSSPLLSPPTEHFDLSISRAKDPIILTVKSGSSYHSNFFKLITEKEYGQGASGSPILNEDNEVVGLLVGCRNPETKRHTILFHPLYRYLWSLGSSLEERE